ncbi:Pkinase domain-containing protein/PP2C domain-containing protein [Cephalotus follicularis]|uniref:Pkinase domain-containing protein/PP2C domain-containing protein n=1 Tax=Cephalotus follicularis TaxID=3775 RepID=A0A1Q3D633_CEPFO|nr:Pkinase domain-containing protein/PP2C domain-containing protein [Cephalotus follicularis]
MRESQLKLYVLGFILFTITPCNGESSTCLMVYKEGGAPAVFQSPKCPWWKLSNYDSPPRSSTTAARCQSAMLQGRRKALEDRTLCALDIRIPFPGKTGLKEVMVGVVAVFDGHNGMEASEMASKLLLDYFALHTYFLLDATFSIVLKNYKGRLLNKGEQDVVFQVLNRDEELGQHELNFERFKFSLPANFDDSFHLKILKEALLRAIDDIDVTFSKEASTSSLHSGTTATVILLADGQILVANIGDSKALLCSESFLSPAEAKATLLRIYREQRRNGAVSPSRDYYSKLSTSDGLAHFTVKELTRDHHPDREDERFRVEAAGGYVLEWGGVARVNGQLAVSRAIGDMSYKRFGVISAPEVTDWQPLTTNDTFLVAASDGVFEKLSLQDVCDLLFVAQNYDPIGSGLSSSCSYSLAECLVNTALQKGSMDNVAAVVVPMDSTIFSQNLLKEKSVVEYDKDCQTIGLQKSTCEKADNGIFPELVHLDNAHPVVAKFDRLVVEKKRGKFGCFYLSEKLNDHFDNTVRAQKVDSESYRYDLPQALPQALDHHCDGDKDQCINPEGFAKFLGLLESIPFHFAGSDHGSSEFSFPDSRYVLKTRFDRGSYGEVWLAFQWNCHQALHASGWCEGNRNNSFNISHPVSYTRNSRSMSYTEDSRDSRNSSFSHDCHAVSPDDDLFILKRIMVEKGPAVYLSGLREKYFGEVFLNASNFFGGSSAGISNSFLEEQSDLNDLLENSESVINEITNVWSFGNTFSNQFRLQKAAFEEGLHHIARYVESVESRSNEIWLVFRHEGVSLSKLMYTVEEAESSADEEKIEVPRIQVLQPSKWWHWLKTTDAGKEEMRNLIRQLLMALKSCHDRNITHRDIKPENMVICFEDQETGRCLKGSPSGDKNFTTKMRIIDFGSAIDEFTMKHLYGSAGPSRAEQTSEYSPPEAFLNASWYKGPTTATLKYDMWSVGVVILEMILGSPNVFQISDRTRALLDHHLEGWNDGSKELAYKLRSFMELCILIPGSSSKHHRTINQDGALPAIWKCSEEFFSHQIKSGDPLKLGFPNVWALRLVRKLLLWEPEDRLSVDDALHHPYFQPPPNG